MSEEPIDLETVPITPEVYPHLNQVQNILNVVPKIRDIVHFKLQMMRNEIIDVL